MPKGLFLPFDVKQASQGLKMTKNVPEKLGSRKSKNSKKTQNEVKT